jgi:hypothetical protein
LSAAGGGFRGFSPRRKKGRTMIRQVAKDYHKPEAGWDEATRKPRPLSMFQHWMICTVSTAGLRHLPDPRAHRSSE